VGMGAPRRNRGGGNTTECASWESPFPWAPQAADTPRLTAIHVDERLLAPDQRRDLAAAVHSNLSARPDPPAPSPRESGVMAFARGFRTPICSLPRWFVTAHELERTANRIPTPVTVASW